jgi:hypothetical protein
MSSWRQRRKFFYLGSVVLVLLIAVGTPAYLKLYKPASCVDHVRNQGEEGIDCGGPCANVCSFSTIDPIVRWARAFPVTTGNYSAVAYIENPNTDATVSSIAYNFRFYDDQNILLAEKNGVTFIPAKKAFPIFETNINTGVRQIKKTFFEFTSIPNWQKATSPVPTLDIISKNITGEAVAPKLSVVIGNGNLAPVVNIAVTAILYDKDDNAIASSQTLLERIGGQGTAEAIFTWPAPFSAGVARIEVFPRIYPN